MKKVITTMSAMTIAAQFNGAQAKQQDQIQPQLLYNDLEMKYSDENNFKGSGFVDVDLLVEKTVTLLADNDGSGTVTEGDTLAYRIQITNIDNAVANNVQLLDELEQNLILNLGTVSTTNGYVNYGNNSYDYDDFVMVTIDQIPVGWFSVINFEADVINLSLGINEISNQADVYNSFGRLFLSDDPNTTAPNDPTLIDAYSELIFDDGFEGSVSGGFF